MIWATMNLVVMDHRWDNKTAPMLDAIPMFGLPIQDKSLQVSFLPLSYDDIAGADKIRTGALGDKKIPFRSHLRRKGGSSDLWCRGAQWRHKSGESLGYWSLEGIFVVDIGQNSKLAAKGYTEGRASWQKQLALQDIHVSSRTGSWADWGVR